MVNLKRRTVMGLLPVNLKSVMFFLVFVFVCWVGRGRGYFKYLCAVKNRGGCMFRCQFNYITYTEKIAPILCYQQ